MTDGQRRTLFSARKFTLALIAGAGLALPACTSGPGDRSASPREAGLTVEAGYTPAASAEAAEDTAINAGDRAPDFQLRDTAGRQVSLDGLLNDGPVVLTWYRGGWCPYCTESLAEFERDAGAIAASGATLVAISPETATNARSTKGERGLGFTLLSDPGNRVANDYGLVFALSEGTRERYRGYGIDLAAANGDNSWTLPLAATYVIDTDGTVAWAFVTDDYTERPDPDRVIEALRRL